MKTKLKIPDFTSGIIHMHAALNTVIHMSKPNLQKTYNAWLWLIIM